MKAEPNALATANADAAAFVEAVSTVSPALAYLDSMGNELSRSSMMYSLNAAAKIIDCSLAGRDAWRGVPWENLCAPVVRAVMARYPGSPASRNKMLAALKGVARAAWELRMLDTDELLRIRGIKGDAGTREIAGRYVPSGEVGSLLRACAEDRSAAGARDAAMISLAAATGARRAEIAGVLATNVTEPEPGRYEIRVIGKRNRERRLYLNGNAALILRDWLAVRFAPGCNSTGPLFWAIRRGGRVQLDKGLSTTALDQILRKRSREANVADVDWHDLRRTLTSNLLEAGADISTVAGILGHSNVQTTARYDRRGERAKLKASELLSVPYFRRS